MSKSKTITTFEAGEHRQTRAKQAATRCDQQVGKSAGFASEVLTDRGCLVRSILLKEELELIIVGEYRVEFEGCTMKQCSGLTFFDELSKAQSYNQTPSQEAQA